MYKCCVESCKNRYSKSKIDSNTTPNNAVSFFEFPASPTMKRSWLENIGRPYYTPVKSARICSQHFHEKDLARKDNTVILDKNTVPLALHPEKNKESTRRRSINSLRSLGENISQNNSKRPNNSLTSMPEVAPKRRRNSTSIGTYDSGVKKAVIPNSTSIVPDNIIRQRRNSVFIGTYDFGVRKNSTSNHKQSNVNNISIGSTANPKSTSIVPENGIRERRNSVFLGTYDFGVRKNSTSKPKQSNVNNISIGSTATPNSTSIVPENGIKRRRNSVVKKVTSKPVKSILKNVSTGSTNQLSIKNFLIKPNASPKQEVDKNASISSRADCIFGWTLMGSYDIPYIVRDSEKYCALRMIEKTALANNEKKNPIIDSFKANVESYDPTTVQCNLLNEINHRHCDSTFGRAPFTSKDKLVRLSDASRYLTFLEVCQKAHLKGAKVSTEGLDFGFTLINKKAYIPYAVLQGQKFIPLTYLQCDGEILEFLTSKSEKISGDDALLLKLCCKYDGILEFNDTMDVIDLTEIQKLSPPKTTFKDCWPTGQKNHQLRVIQTTKGLRLEYFKRVT